jgi:GNAT superfamily N-acetyltransferase
MMGGVSWRIRAFVAAADRAWVRLLWQAAMPPSWPVLSAGIGQLDEGLVAQAGHVRVGFAALDAGGSIPLILVEPAYQRRGIGTGLLDAALRQLRAGSVTAGSGGTVYIWPGVPRDLPAAVSFFAARGWRHTHDTLDLVTDLAGYRPPQALPGAPPQPASRSHGRPQATCRPWARSKRLPSPAGPAGSPPPARSTSCSPGPGPGPSPEPCYWRAPARTACSRRCSARPQGPSAASASPRHCTGRASGRPWSCASQILSQAGVRACHIGWTTRESFYRRAGYQPWRRYAMYSSPA